jgi:hypothetical protein
MKRNLIRRKNPSRCQPADFEPGRKRLCNARLAKKPGQRCKRFATPGHWRCHYHGSRCPGPRPRFTPDGERVSNIHHARRGLARWQAEIRRLIENGHLLRFPGGRKTRDGLESDAMRARRLAMAARHGPPPPPPRPPTREEIEEAERYWAEQDRLAEERAREQRRNPARVDDGPPICGSPWLRAQRSRSPLYAPEQPDIFTSYYRQQDVSPAESRAQAEAALRRIRGR